MKRFPLLSPAWLAGFVLLAGVATRGAAPADLQRIVPFTDPHTVVVARLDLGGLDAKVWASSALDLLPEWREAMRGAVEQASPRIQAWVEEFRKAGADVLYLLVSLSDVGFEPPVAVVVPLADGGDADRAGTMLKQAGAFPGLNTAVLRGCVIAASDPVLERLKTMPSRPPRELESAFAAAPPGSLQFALLPYEEADRVIQEFMPVLPASLGGGSSSALTRGLAWATLTLEAPPKLGLEFLVRSQSAADAEAFARLIDRGLTALGKVDEVQKHLPRWGEIEAALKPNVAGETLRVRLETSQIAELVQTVAMPALQESQAKATRIMILNNLKQIGLALVMYADDHDGKLPDHLADTLAYVGSASVLLPPGSGVQPPEDLQRRDRAAQVAWLDQHGGLVYLHPGVPWREIKDPAKTPLVHQQPALSREPFVGVCFADGHAEYMTKEAFDRLLEQRQRSSP